MLFVVSLIKKSLTFLSKFTYTKNQLELNEHIFTILTLSNKMFDINSKLKTNKL